MLNEADKFNKNIRFNGNEYEFTFLGKTVKNERLYFVSSYLNGKSDGSFEMRYNPETGNFYVADSSKAIPEEFEQLLSDAIQNHHL